MKPGKILVSLQLERIIKKKKTLIKLVVQFSAYLLTTHPRTPVTAADLFYTEQNDSDPSRVKIPFTFRISMYEPSENEILFDFSNRHAWKLRKKTLIVTVNLS